MQELILGGARSGKSAYAEAQASALGLPVTYIATAEAADAEMAARIAHHRRQRPPEWSLVEEALALASVLQRHAHRDQCIIIDCLTLWLSNLLAAGEERMQSEIAALFDVLPDLPGHLLLVSNEVGWGIVPDNALARRFRDEAGRLHQRLAACCPRVTLVVAGLPLRLKGAL